MMKPDPRIFPHLLERFALEPGETVFLDDNAENVRAAEEAGFISFAPRAGCRSTIDSPALGREMTR